MTEPELAKVLGAVLLRAFEEIRAATAPMAIDDTGSGKARGNDVNGSVRPRPSPRRLKDEIAELLEDGTWRTTAEIAEKEKGGIGARRGDVEACLSRRDLFVAANGREHARSPRATLYQLVDAKTTGAILPPEIAGTATSSHDGQEGHGASRAELGLVEHPPSSARLRTVELRVPTIKLLIGSDDR